MSTPLQKAYEAMSDAVYAETRTGSEARQTVLDIAVLLGIDLGRNPLGGQTWSPSNMARVTRAVADLKQRASENKHPVERGTEPHTFL